MKCLELATQVFDEMTHVFMMTMRHKKVSAMQINDQANDELSTPPSPPFAAAAAAVNAASSAAARAAAAALLLAKIVAELSMSTNDSFAARLRGRVSAAACSPPPAS
jgi:hypothetical protein